MAKKRTKKEQAESKRRSVSQKLAWKWRKKRERIEHKRRSKAAVEGSITKQATRIAKETGRDLVRVRAGLVTAIRTTEREEYERRSAASKLGWRRKWIKEGRKLTPPRKPPPVTEPREPETKTKLPELPKVKPKPRDTPEGECQVMLERINAAVDSINVDADEKIATKLGPVVNDDSTVDGELLVFVPRGKSILEVTDWIEEGLRAPKGQWITIGIRVPPNKAVKNPEDYDKVLGLIQIQIHPRHSQYAGNMFDDWRDEVWEKIEKGTKGWRKPEQLYVRLFWHPEGIRPDF